MAHAPHIERHFSGNDMVRDIVLGMADGLTVPFALAAGLSGVVEGTGLVVTAGLAEIAAGCIAMGLGGYLAGRSDQDHYDNEKRREEQEVRDKPEHEAEEVRVTLRGMGLEKGEIEPIVDALRKRPDVWVNFMMKMELGLDAPKPRRALASAVTIGAAYVLGGIIPLLSYIFIRNGRLAFQVSVGVTLAALAVFGFVKGRYTGARPVRSAVQTVLIGGLAAGAAFALAKLWA